MPPIRPPPPRPENPPPVHPPTKRALEASVESLVEVEDGSQVSGAQKYFELDPSKVYLKITDIVKDFAKIYGACWIFRHADYMKKRKLAKN